MSNETDSGLASLSRCRLCSAGHSGAVRKTLALASATLATKRAVAAAKASTAATSKTVYATHIDLHFSITSATMTTINTPPSLSSPAMASHNTLFSTSTQHTTLFCSPARLSSSRGTSTFSTTSAFTQSSLDHVSVSNKLNKHLTSSSSSSSTPPRTPPPSSPAHRTINLSSHKSPPTTPSPSTKSPYPPPPTTPSHHKNPNHILLSSLPVHRRKLICRPTLGGRFSTPPFDPSLRPSLPQLDWPDDIQGPWSAASERMLHERRKRTQHFVQWLEKEDYSDVEEEEAIAREQDLLFSLAQQQERDMDPDVAVLLAAAAAMNPEQHHQTQFLLQQQQEEEENQVRNRQDEIYHPMVAKALRDRVRKETEAKNAILVQLQRQQQLQTPQRRQGQQRQTQSARRRQAAAQPDIYDEDDVFSSATTTTTSSFVTPRKRADLHPSFQDDTLELDSSPTKRRRKQSSRAALLPVSTETAIKFPASAPAGGRREKKAALALTKTTRTTRRGGGADPPPPLPTAAVETAGVGRKRNSTSRKVANFRHGFTSSDDEDLLDDEHELQRHHHHSQEGVVRTPSPPPPAPLPSSSSTTTTTSAANVMMAAPASEMDDVFSTPSRMLHSSASGWGSSWGSSLATLGGSGSRQRNVSGGSVLLGFPQTPSRFGSGTPLMGGGTGTPHHFRGKSSGGRQSGGHHMESSAGGGSPRTPRSDAMTLIGGGGGGVSGMETVSPCLSRSLMRGSLGMGIGGIDSHHSGVGASGGGATHPASLSALLESPTGGLGFGSSSLAAYRPGSSGRRSGGSTTGMESWKYNGGGLGLGTPGTLGMMGWGGQPLKVRQVSGSGMSSTGGAGVGVDTQLGLGIGFDFDDVLDLC
ncbi:hypothetical protein CF319_g5771 [Tilletia indica]|nr:hypothetical protein CF319_g5771 [Tilletia indica]